MPILPMNSCRWRARGEWEDWTEAGGTLTRLLEGENGSKDYQWKHSWCVVVIPRARTSWIQLREGILNPWGQFVELTTCISTSSLGGHKLYQSHSQSSSLTCSVLEILVTRASISPIWLVGKLVALYPGNLSLVIRPFLPLAFANCKRSKTEAEESLGRRLDEASDPGALMFTDAVKMLHFAIT